MTLEFQQRFNSYTGNGVTLSFPYTFRCFDNEDIVVMVNGVEKLLGVDYSVTDVGEADGGAIVFVAAPAVDAVVFIDSQMDIVQGTKYAQGGQFPAATHEIALDRMTAVLQEMNEGVKTSVHFPPGDTASAELPSVADRANGYLGFDSDGNFTKMPPEAGTAAQVAADRLAAEAAASAAAQSAANAAQFDPALLVVSGSNLYLVDNYNCLMY